ncbi:hypothetical protein A1Q1_06022 [Trichosporon asahii var. asahii CBS 2479]|uniref:G-patch domain-containing protein n=1 Tax=Trichosporon asahii var. asahii (strain ATCC 90039 / CBS 2479 / JCM 2466 / KCTC 7840 / NBRC 103889/ NCYC 2677 / UAMH 7654) TaxID=1186058 RepID=J5SGY9_TRIAS|nr:hypothetical protein A1Q1_06022 [Trichosporon asahii var. asahii CBS 2479]EJT45576.1 hypothetical protein A1Q1_06022 [Trichosporon asahii var. asahii CBS 2479]
MSDSEDDFMSDKFLVDAPSASEQTYSARRAAAQRKSAAKVAAHTAQQRPLREIEAERRKAGLARNLLADSDDEDEDEGEGRGKLAAKPKRTEGQSKAMGLMKAMGWTPGEALGRRRSASPPSKSRATEPSDPTNASSSSSGHAGIGARGRERAEPIRISMWAGRRGLAARTPSPPPLHKKESNLESLAADVERFRGRRGAEEEQRANERKAHKARELLVEFDTEKGVVFHPLHADPLNPGALPTPLRARLWPDATPPPSPPLDPATTRADPTAEPLKFRNEAERVRAQMRRDMLTTLGPNADDEDIRFSISVPERDEEKEALKQEAADEKAMDWDEVVSGTKRVLAMNAADNLAFLVSQLRNEHLFCFWCASKYASFEEMDAPGGCPGEEEDDH